MAADHIKTIHLIFKTHLDIGFTDYARNVTAQYMAHFIPRAIETAATLRASTKAIGAVSQGKSTHAPLEPAAKSAKGTE